MEALTITDKTKPFTDTELMKLADILTDREIDTVENSRIQASNEPSEDDLLDKCIIKSQREKMEQVIKLLRGLGELTPNNMKQLYNSVSYGILR